MFPGQQQTRTGSFFSRLSAQIMKRPWFPSSLPSTRSQNGINNPLSSKKDQCLAFALSQTQKEAFYQFQKKALKRERVHVRLVIHGFRDLLAEKRKHKMSNCKLHFSADKSYFLLYLRKNQRKMNSYNHLQSNID